MIACDLRRYTGSVGRPENSAGGAAQFQELLEPHLNHAFGMAVHLTRNRDDAADLVQDATLNAFRAFHTFQPGTNFRAWYFKVLINAHLARRRAEQRRPQQVDLDMDVGDVGKLYLYRRTHAAGLHEHDTDPARSFMSRMSVTQVQNAIQSLPEEFRVVAVLWFLLEMNTREIAQVLDCQPGTVRTRLHRARRKLQKMLWELAEDEGIVASRPAEVAR